MDLPAGFRCNQTNFLVAHCGIATVLHIYMSDGMVILWYCQTVNRAIPPVLDWPYRYKEVYPSTAVHCEHCKALLSKTGTLSRGDHSLIEYFHFLCCIICEIRVHYVSCLLHFAFVILLLKTVHKFFEFIGADILWVYTVR